MRLKRVTLFTVLTLLFLMVSASTDINALTIQTESGSDSLSNDSIQNPTKINLTSSNCQYGYCSEYEADMKGNLFQSNDRDWYYFQVNEEVEVEIYLDFPYDYGRYATFEVLDNTAHSLPLLTKHTYGRDVYYEGKLYPGTYFIYVQEKDLDDVDDYYHIKIEASKDFDVKIVDFNDELDSKLNGEDRYNSTIILDSHFKEYFENYFYDPSALITRDNISRFDGFEGKEFISARMYLMDVEEAERFLLALNVVNYILEEDYDQYKNTKAGTDAGLAIAKTISSGTPYNTFFKYVGKGLNVAYDIHAQNMYPNVISKVNSGELSEADVTNDIMDYLTSNDGEILNIMFRMFGDSSLEDIRVEMNSLYARLAGQYEVQTGVEYGRAIATNYRYYFRIDIFAKVDSFLNCTEYIEKGGIAGDPNGTVNIPLVKYVSSVRVADSSSPFGYSFEFENVTDSTDQTYYNSAGKENFYFNADLYIYERENDRDTTAPVINSRNVTIYSNVSSKNWANYFSVTDDSGDVIVFEVHDGVNYGTVGTYSVAITAIDSTGNTTTKSFIVTVKKYVAPTPPPPTKPILVSF